MSASKHDSKNMGELMTEFERFVAEREAMEDMLLNDILMYSAGEIAQAIREGITTVDKVVDAMRREVYGKDE